MFFFLFFFSSISALPVDLRKNMASIRSYDVKQQALHSKLLAEQAVFVAQAKQKAEAGEPIDDERLQTLKEQYRTVLALCDKKVPKKTKKKKKKKNQDLFCVSWFLIFFAGESCQSSLRNVR